MIAASVILLGGLAYMAIKEAGLLRQALRPGTRRYRQGQAEGAIQLVEASLHGEAHSILTLGLLVLTLVPLGRVVFTLALFIHERDVIYIVATSLTF